MRKYLDDIGVTDRPDTWEPKNDIAARRQSMQRQMYGFDEREQWNLDYTFYLWLYEHLMAYKEQSAYLNLDDKRYTYKGKMWTQRELIDMMLDRLCYAFVKKNYDDNENDSEYVHEIEKIWSFILPAMWN